MSARGPASRATHTFYVYTAETGPEQETRECRRPDYPPPPPAIRFAVNPSPRRGEVGREAAG